ncbi:hypothetical protein [Candidatus Palauibacter sp.]|uniref:hypothetical protein n=1 Tax=Candidatus Palauibacter sp. TaxID=3101350 RepID=UPI003B01520E
MGTEYDSAGVKVVTNPRVGVWTRGTAWRVERDLTIGTETGMPEYQFGRVVDVEVRPDGRIYALDQMSARVRVFNSRGEYLFSFGGLGEGPGELSNHEPLGALAVLADSAGDLLVVDRVSNRLNRFTGDGEFLGYVDLGVQSGRVEPIVSAVLPNGDHLVHRVVRDTWNGILRVGSRDGRILDTLLAFSLQPRAWGLAQRNAQGRTEALMHSPLWAILPDGRVVAGRSDQSSFQVWGPNKRLEMVVRRHEENPVLSESGQERYLDRLMEIWETMFKDEGESEEWVEEQIGRGREVYIPPERLPAVTGFAWGPEGTIWVRAARPVELMTWHVLYARPPVREFWSRNWDVFSADGRLLGTVVLPPRFTLLRIRGLYIYGVEEDDLGVQRVVRLRLQTH